MKWYDIPDFPSYQISENCTVISKKTNRNIKPSPDLRSNCSSFQLTGEDRLRHFCSEPRLLYCAVRGISPLKIDRTIRFSWKNKNKKSFDNILVLDFIDAAKSMSAAYRNARIPNDVFYKEVIEFSNYVLSKDYSGINAVIDRYQREIKKCLAVHSIAFNAEKSECIYNIIKGKLIEGISSGCYQPVHPLYYIKTMVRGLSKKCRTNKERIYEL